LNDYEFVGTLKQSINLNIDGTNREVSVFVVKIAFVDANIEKE
jgi:hypothetical protein